MVRVSLGLGLPLSTQLGCVGRVGGRPLSTSPPLSLWTGAVVCWDGRTGLLRVAPRGFSEGGSPKDFAKVFLPRVF